MHYDIFSKPLILSNSHKGKVMILPEYNYEGSD